MKTPEKRKEFLQKLRVVASESDDLLTSCDASDLLDGLEVSRDFMFESACLIEQLESRLAQAERERDAAVRAISIAQHYINDLGALQYGLQQLEHWDYELKWRGICPENTKEAHTNAD